MRLALFPMTTAVRIREILEHVGLRVCHQISSSQVLANLANLLNIRDTELSSFLVAMADLSLRKTAVEEKRAKVQLESKELLDYVRKAIARLTYLKLTFSQLEDEIAPCEAQIEQWNTNVAVMDSKERQYLQQYSNYDVENHSYASSLSSIMYKLL
ncbi:AUGMIN subunit 1-like isoform X1 [Primulina huaijiensis]|uniref:AUGMIN subunit 1-like isoform X1 n=1 Tax=Primulina huaijiensis TaxID=1492673 RepID=UPI003CC72C44